MRAHVRAAPPLRCLAVTKVKDGAAEKVKHFYEECDRLAEEEASATPLLSAERMADEVGGSLRPIMVPTPLR